jgi:23S rRNA (cytosine1962-C5)-methyltransferase
MSEIKPYKLLDTGFGRKLEDLGGFRVDRQATTAFWPPHLSASNWSQGLCAKHVRSENGGGHWELQKKSIPESWWMICGPLKMKTKLTAFGHCGLFAEQISQWEWIAEETSKFIDKKKRPPEILNLFAYTGGSSIAAALAGAKVTHVDAAKGVVDWARDNANENGVPHGTLRFIVEDAIVFLKKEAKRGRKYDGVIFDPPSFGRGPKGESFQIEKDIKNLLESILAVLSDDVFLFHWASHTPGFSPWVLKQMAESYFKFLGEKAWANQQGEMLIPVFGQEKFLPSGVFYRTSKSHV